MRNVTVVYHCEDGNWWADSPDPGLETFVAGGRSFEETRRLAWEGAEFHLGEEVTLLEMMEDGTSVDAPPVTTVSLSVRFSVPGEVVPMRSTSSQAVFVGLAPAPAVEILRPIEVA